MDRENGAGQPLLHLGHSNLVAFLLLWLNPFASSGLLGIVEFLKCLGLPINIPGFGKKHSFPHLRIDIHMFPFFFSYSSFLEEFQAAGFWVILMRVLL